MLRIVALYSIDKKIQSRCPRSDRYFASRVAYPCDKLRSSEMRVKSEVRYILCSWRAPTVGSGIHASRTVDKGQIVRDTSLTLMELSRPCRNR